MTSTRKLRPNLCRIQDLVARDILDDMCLEPVRIGDGAFCFLSDMAARMLEHPELEVRPLKGVPPGDRDEVDIVLVHPDTMAIFDVENAIGLFNLTTPEGDPFGDEAPYARRFRVVLPYEAEWVRSQIRDADPDWPDFGAPSAGALSWLLTLAHELSHVRVLAETGACNSPADLDVMADENGHNLFDRATGYGIMPLRVDGKDVWAETMDEARELLERHVEDCGARIVEQVCHGDLSPLRFLDLLDQDCATEPEPSP